MKTPEFFRRLLSFPNLLVFLFTLPFLGIGVSEAVKVRQMLASFESATGIVIDNDYQTSPDPDDPAREAGAYFPVVKFSSSQGGNTTFTDGVGSIPPDYEIGDSVEILYNPQNPREAKIKSWKRIWFAPTLFIAISLLPVAMVLVWTAAQVRGRARRKL